MNAIDNEILQVFRSLSEDHKQVILDLLATSTAQEASSSGRL